MLEVGVQGERDCVSSGRFPYSQPAHERRNCRRSMREEAPVDSDN